MPTVPNQVDPRMALALHYALSRCATRAPGFRMPLAAHRFFISIMECNGMKRRLTSLPVLIGCAILLWSIAVLGQVIKGSISGTVTDPQGAVVSDAKVKAVNTQTNV